MFLRRLYWISFCLFCSFAASAQQSDTLTMSFVEAHSYQLYLDKDWKALSRFCDKALRKGYDYYYLRMRAGISCYETHNYRKAISHFSHALDFNSGDETALTYLYASYRYSAQFEEARNLSRQMDTSLQRLVGADKLKSLSFIALEAATRLSDSAVKFNPAVYIQLSGQHYLRNRLSLFHALTFYGQDEYRQKIRQYQYYVSAAIPVKNNWILSPALHVLYADLRIRQITTTTTVVMQQQPPMPGQPQQPPQQVVSVKTNTTFVSRQTSALSGSLMLSKKLNYFDLSVGITASVFDTANQYQLQAGFSCYPLGNRKLAIGGTLCHHTETDYRQSDLALMPYISSLIHPRLLLSALWIGNRGGNIVEGNAYLINNSIDLSVSRFQGMAEYAISEHLRAYVVYSHDTRREKFEGFHYHYQLALLGIKFIP